MRLSLGSRLCCCPGFAAEGYSFRKHLGFDSLRFCFKECLDDLELMSLDVNGPNIRFSSPKTALDTAICLVHKKNLVPLKAYASLWDFFVPEPLSRVKCAFQNPLDVELVSSPAELIGSLRELWNCLSELTSSLLSHPLSYILTNFRQTTCLLIANSSDNLSLRCVFPPVESRLRSELMIAKPAMFYRMDLRTITDESSFEAISVLSGAMRTALMQATLTESLTETAFGVGL